MGSKFKRKAGQLLCFVELINFIACHTAFQFQNSMLPPHLTEKPHYPILDGLRGVAALMVVVFHIFEAHATSFMDQIVNHGYLAVDFFFLLSGFVISYAYDDRWETLSFREFARRRIIRLQPMLIMGTIVGALLFYTQDSTLFPNIHSVPVWQVLGLMLIGFTLLPIPPSMDIRGWAEMHPLNGPAWSLFYEYVANILYGLFIRKFSQTALSVLVVLSGAALVHLLFTSPAGYVVGGWTLDSNHIHIGLCRVMFPFFAGLLLCRWGKQIRIPNAFFWSSALVILIMAMPRLGSKEEIWMNALYEAFAIILLFPLVVSLGAGGKIIGERAQQICSFLGRISYPIYITHYPIIYLYTSWVVDHKYPMKEVYPVAILVFVSSVTLAWACLKWFDEPVRKWLAMKWK